MQGKVKNGAAIAALSVAALVAYKQLPVADVLSVPGQVTNVMEAYFPAQNASSAIFSVSYDLITWTVFSTVDYPVDGDTLRATNVSTNAAAFYRAGIIP